MKTNRFKIRGLGPGLDSLEVVVTDNVDPNIPVREVIQIRNPNVMIGDRELNVKVAEGSMFLSNSVLEPILEEIKQFDSSNNYGKQVGPVTTVTIDDHDIVTVRYENVVTVTLIKIETDQGPDGKSPGVWRKRTLASKNFTPGDYTLIFEKNILQLVTEHKIDELKELLRKKDG